MKPPLCESAAASRPQPDLAVVPIRHRDTQVVGNGAVPVPTGRHREVLAGLLGATAPAANLVPDAHLAALAIEHGLMVTSTDGDFARFPGLRWQNPLVTR